MQDKKASEGGRGEEKKREKTMNYKSHCDFRLLETKGIKNSGIQKRKQVIPKFL